MNRLSSEAVHVRAPAKINLCLGVGRVRADGYHPLATVYHAIALYDVVTAQPADTWSVRVVSERHDAVEVPLDASNLALRSAYLLAGHHGVDQPVALTLDKAIPVAGGLAGGSADAAAALVACDLLWGTRTDPGELLGLAGRLGSDVPFGLLGGTAAGSGRGELVEPLADTGTYGWVVLESDRGLSTPAVYHDFDVVHVGATLPDPVLPAALVEALAAGDPRALGGALTNDLQPSVLRLRPELAQRLRAGLDASAYGALVSGSGPTCVFVCEDVAHADRVAMLLREHDLGAVSVAQGPVPGARNVDPAGG